MPFPSFVELSALMLPDVCFFLYLCFLGCVERTGVSLSSLQPDDDSLMAVVNLLKANWISV
jgi:hypothetical protein